MQTKTGRQHYQDDEGDNKPSELIYFPYQQKVEQKVEWLKTITSMTIQKEKFSDKTTFKSDKTSWKP